MENADEVPAIERELVRRRAAVAVEWGHLDAIVLIGAGGLIARPGRDDTTYRFDAHAEYYYLTDRNVPAGVHGFDPGDGWFDFEAPVTESDRLWSGAQPADAGPPEHR